MRYIIKIIKKTEISFFFINSIIFNLIGLIIFYFLTSIYSFDPVLVIILASPIIFISNYYVQSNLIFKKKASLNSFTKFILNVGVHYFLNIILLFLMVNILKFNHMISQVIILIFLFFLNFLISKKIIFKKK